MTESCVTDLIIVCKYSHSIFMVVVLANKFIFSQPFKFNFLLTCSIHWYCESGIFRIKYNLPYFLFYKFKSIAQGIYFKNNCILHNDSNFSNLVWFKMNHCSFLIWRLLIRNHPFSLSHLAMTLSFLKLINF